MNATRCAVGLAVAFAGITTCPRVATAQDIAPPPRVESFVPGIAFSVVQVLPRAPAAERADCVRLTTKAASRAAAQVAAAGWAVTGEARLGRLQAVAFVGGARGGTSGSCLLTQGNLALFDGTRLLDIAYAEPGARATIGGIEQLASDAIRLWDGDELSQPIADIRQGTSTLAVLPLAPEQRFCAGRAVVPNIYGLPIDIARRLLDIKQWAPLPGEPVAGGIAEGREGELAKRGVVEVESYSGTGFGYCAFRYRNAAARLNVTTIGDADLPAVSGYDVRCDG